MGIFIFVCILAGVLWFLVIGPKITKMREEAEAERVRVERERERLQKIKELQNLVTSGNANAQKKLKESLIVGTWCHTRNGYDYRFSFKETGEFSTTAFTGWKMLIGTYYIEGDVLHLKATSGYVGYRGGVDYSSRMMHEYTQDEATFEISFSSNSVELTQKDGDLLTLNQLNLLSED